MCGKEKGNFKMKEESAVDAIILAAGYASRANGFKMQFKIGEKAVLQYVIEAFVPICKKIIVVGGYQSDKLLPLIKPYGNQIQLVINDSFEAGMFSSVKVGVKEVNSGRFFLTPGDCPLITKQVCQTLLESNKDFVIPSFHKKGGHPVLLPASCIQELLLEAEESNLKQFLKKQSLTYIEMQEDGIIYDLDTRQDYLWLKERMKAQEGK